MKFLKDFSKIAIITFVLNFIWEITQMIFYAPHTNGVSDFILRHIWASLGDIVIVFVIFIFTAIVFKDLFWYKKLNIWKIISAAILGMAVAIIIEKYALLSGRWKYNNLMPIISLVGVGLFPVSQMMILPTLSLKIKNVLSNIAK